METGVGNKCVEFIRALTGVNWNKISVRVYIGDINAMMEKR